MMSVEDPGRQSEAGDNHHGHTGSGDEPTHIPASARRRFALSFAKFPQNVAREEGRRGGHGRTTEQIPELFVFFAFHGADLTPLYRESCFRAIRFRRLRESLPVSGFGWGAAFCEGPWPRSAECVR